MTLTGASDEYTNNVTSDLDDDEEDGPSIEGKDVRALQKTLLRRNRRYNNQAVEATMTTKEVVKQDDDEGRSVSRTQVGCHGDTYSLVDVGTHVVFFTKQCFYTGIHSSTIPSTFFTLEGRVRER